MVNWDRQRCWDEIGVGDQLAPLEFPLSVYRLVVVAGANRDFNSIHHNSAVAKAAGAPEMYANAYFLQGMWERLVREFIGVQGKFVRLTGFKMHRFNPVGRTVVVRGRVIEKWRTDDLGLAAITVTSETEDGVTVGPGTVTVALPLDGQPPSQQGIARWLTDLHKATPEWTAPLATAEPGSWQRDWRPVQDRIGAELGEEKVIFGADPLDASSLRRFLEPLEFDCPLHNSAAIARREGFTDVVAPWSAAIPFTTAAFWRPGDPPAFVGTTYDAQPRRSPYAIHEPVPGAPRTSAFVATETSVMEFDAPMVLGDNVGRIGRRLVDCQPKQARVGRGAFVRFESRIVNQSSDTIMRNIRQYFYYNP